MALSEQLPLIDIMRDAPDEKAAALQLLFMPLEIMVLQQNAFRDVLAMRKFDACMGYLENCMTAIRLVRRPDKRLPADNGYGRVALALNEAGAVLAQKLWGGAPPHLDF